MREDLAALRAALAWALPFAEDCPYHDYSQRKEIEPGSGWCERCEKANAARKLIDRENVGRT